MMNLFGEKHTWPQFALLPLIASATALLRSASIKTTNESFPPSYMTDFLRYCPALEAMNEPALELPVKLTPPTELCERIVSI